MHFVEVLNNKKNGRKYPINNFIIPFSFNAGLYDETVEKMLEGEWKSVHELPTNEFFPHIQELVSNRSETSILSRFKRAKKDISLFDRKSGTIPGQIESIEILLFRTGIGFYQYSVNYTDSIDINDLVEMNNQVKAIAHSNFSITVRKEVRIDFSTDLLAKENDPEGVPVTHFHHKGKPEQKRIKPSCLEKALLEKDIKIIDVDDKNSHLIFTSSTELQIRDFINQELEIVPGIAFFNPFYYGDGKEKQMASKANVFVVGVLEQPAPKEIDLAGKSFLLARGYKSSYKNTEGSQKDVFNTFDNSYWSVSREGVANIAWLTADSQTNSFFTNTYFDRIENYCFLYILALHQYYSLIKAAHNIAHLPFSFDDYSHNNENYQRLMQMYNDVNYIYLKCIYHEVTHISHQAYFYQEIFERLGIESLLSEINFEMDRLTSIGTQLRDKRIIEQREEDQKRQQKEDERQKTRDKLFAIIGGIFAFITLFEPLSKFGELLQITNLFGSNTDKRIIYLGFPIFLMILVVFMGFSVFRFWIWRNKKRKNDRN